MIKDYLEIGQIVGTHGVRGELRVQPWCDSPEFFKKFKTLYYDAHGEKSAGVVGARAHGNIALLRLDGCDTVEKAASLRGKVLYIRRSDAHLKKGDWFIAELIGWGRKQRPSLRHCYRRQSDGRKRRLAYNGRRRGRDAYPRNSRCCVER